MNIDKLTNSITLWKDVSIFPTFNQLVEISKNYYYAVRIVLLSKDERLFDVTFEFEHNKNFSKYKFCTIHVKNLFSEKIDYEEYFYSLNNHEKYSKYSFSKRIQNDLLNCNYNDKIVKWCLLSELYSKILSTVK